MTESGLSILSHSLYLNYASVGWPTASMEVKIVNVDDTSDTGLDANCKGEILLRGPSIMKGYLKNEKATQASITNGWFRTGDIGKYDENGDFYIVDRTKDLIKVQANQVSPAELEDILLSHPLVFDAAVIGVKHEKFGEAPKAIIVRKDSKLNAQDIQTFIKERCAKYKWLSGGVQFTDVIPRNSAGKILKRDLK